MSVLGTWALLGESQFGPNKKPRCLVAMVQSSSDTGWPNGCLNNCATRLNRARTRRNVRDLWFYIQASVCGCAMFFKGSPEHVLLSHVVSLLAPTPSWCPSPPKRSPEIVGRAEAGTKAIHPSGLRFRLAWQPNFLAEEVSLPFFVVSKCSAQIGAAAALFR